ncbi:MAG: queuosine precursor transporter [Pyrodictiaceae archaeon]
MQVKDLEERDIKIVTILAGIFSASIVMANILAGVKLENIGVLLGLPLIVPAGTIAYAWTFPITDIVDEVYGKRMALFIVWAGLAAELSMLLLIVLDLPIPAIEPAMQELYNKVFLIQPRIVLASIAAYIVAQHHDVWAFWKWREITRGKHLWIRNNASTIVSQLLDSSIFTTIAFAGLVSWQVLASMILTMWLFKVLIALLDTPFVYLGVMIIKRREITLVAPLSPRES